MERALEEYAKGIVVPFSSGGTGNKLRGKLYHTSVNI